MPVNKVRSLTTLLTMTVLGLPQNSLAETVSCSEKYDRYAQAQITWQNASAERAVKLLPDYSDRIYQYRDTQLVLIERRQLAVELTLKNYPDKVANWGSINQWIELTPELEAQLMQDSPEFKRLTEKLNGITSQEASEGHEEFSQTFRRTAIADDEFMQLMDDFNLQSREVNSLGCDK